MPPRSESEHVDLLRTLDAAANRAREGLRVLEDYVRFSLDDAYLTGLLKDCRHALTGALQQIDVGQRLAARDTLGDVGTEITTPGESHREQSTDLLLANFKRVQEALRTLEEFTKSGGQRAESREQDETAPWATSGSSPSALRSSLFRQLRYRLYTLEKAVIATEANRCRLADRRLYLLVSEALCRRGFETVIQQALAAGAGVVQLREKTMSDRQFVDRGKQVRDWTRQAGALFIINDRPDVAVLTDADGVHVGQNELTVREARRIVGPRRLIGVSTHNIDQAGQAVLDGADYLGVGPVFASETKQFDQLAGLDFVRHVAAEITLPWFAIGGISADNVDRVLEAGATHIAVSAALCGAEEPGQAAQDLLRRLGEH